MPTKLVVIGGGISGLATAFRAQQRLAANGAAAEIRLLEGEERVGGKIRSEQAQGFVVEWGPNGFLDSKPETLRLCRDLGLQEELLPSNDAARKRFIFSAGRLHRVPEGPGAFFRSPLLSVRGRLRILREAWAPATPEGLDTSIAEFGRRRLGREAMEKLLDPMVSGIFAGDPAIMSLASCFPRIAEMEREHGSLLRAMRALARQRKATGGAVAGQEPGAKGAGGSAASGGPAGPGGTLTSLKGGMERLVEALVRELGRAVTPCTRVVSILPAAEGAGAGARFRILCRQQGVEREYPADAVVLAVPAHQAARILERLDPEASRLLAQIVYAPVAVVALGFPEDEAPGPLDGFGFLVPYQEGLPLLGSLWTSSIFPGRAPGGTRLTRNMLGGWRNGWTLACEDGELEEMTLGVMERALGARGKARFRTVIRHPEAIPLYTVGHGERLRRVEERLKRTPGLFLTGNAYRGVAINDCTREAERVAREVEAGLRAAGAARGNGDAGRA